jgi:hypothetical protein
MIQNRVERGNPGTRQHNVILRVAADIGDALDRGEVVEGEHPIRGNNFKLIETIPMRNFLSGHDAKLISNDSVYVVRDA